MMLDPETLSPEKRSQVLMGAAAVFSTDGYEGASMSRIAHEAGVSKGTLYNYFETKAHLFAAYVGQQCHQKLEQVFSPNQLEGTPVEVLTGIGSRMMAMMLSPTGLTVHRVVTSEAQKFPELAKIFYDAGPARAIGALSNWLEAGHRFGAPEGRGSRLRRRAVLRPLPDPPLPAAHAADGQRNRR